MCNQCAPNWESWQPASKLFDKNCYCGVALDHMIFPYPNDPVQTTWLYRHYGDAQRLLYVGISNDPLRRLSEHVETSNWVGLLRYTTYEIFDSRNEALDAEWVAIRDEDPDYNVIRRPPPYWKEGQTEIPLPYVDHSCSQKSCAHKGHA